MTDKVQILVEPEIARLLQHRDFNEDSAEYEGVIDEDDLIMDVLILARVKRPEDVGTGGSGLVILSDNQVDDMMVEGMLSRALVIQQSDILDINKDD